MPRKRRASKRRQFAAELEIWELVFMCGSAFTGDLARVGLIDPRSLDAGPRREEVRAEFMRAARDAWNRLGLTFLAENQNARWAFEQLGEPQCR
jgi:hypothetical protein